MFKGFREFLFRGNVVDLAVAVVIGGALTAIINAIVDGLINPLIAAIFGNAELASVGTFDINGAHFSIGLILDATVKFVSIAAVIYFCIILPMNKMMARRKKGTETQDEPSADIRLLTEIRDLLQKESA